VSAPACFAPPDGVPVGEHRRDGRGRCERCGDEPAPVAPCGVPPPDDLDDLIDSLRRAHAAGRPVEFEAVPGLSAPACVLTARYDNHSVTIVDRPDIDRVARALGLSVPQGPAEAHAPKPPRGDLIGGIAAAHLRKAYADGRELALRAMGHPYRQLRDSDYAEADLAGLRAVAAAGAARWQEANGRPPVFCLPADARPRLRPADWAGWEPHDGRDGAYWLELPGPAADPGGGDLIEVAPAVRYLALSVEPVVLLEIDGTCVVNDADASVRPRLTTAQARAMARALETVADEADRRAARATPTGGTGLAR
jgi:hypothetical protein